MLQLDAVFDKANLTDDGFNGHPPLGVNATVPERMLIVVDLQKEFQRAPTLGGECYTVGT